MAGTLMGLGLSQQHDINGEPLVGALLYIYEAGTSTPATTYSNSGLIAGQELPHPIEADANGRIPSFWVDDGSYRARLTTAEGVVQFDEDNIPAIGPSAGGGGGVDTTDPNSISSTGDVKWRPYQGTLAGWVRLNGRTIGSAASGASERANADCLALFQYIYANFTDAFCPVSGGRTGNSADDFTINNKTITLLDMRNKSPFGLDDMGNSAVGGFGGITFDQGDATTAGSKGGDATHTLTLAQIPAHDHGGVTSSNGAHTHVTDVGHSGTAQSGAGTSAGSHNTSENNNLTSSSDGAHIHTISSAGSGSAHPTISPFMLGTWYIRL
jgi:microcystin-dependent protein